MATELEAGAATALEARIATGLTAGTTATELEVIGFSSATGMSAC
jgi:hypothetical protein